MDRRTWIAAVASFLFGAKCFSNEPSWEFMEKRKVGDKVFDMKTFEFYSDNSKYSGIVLDPHTFIPYSFPA